MSAQTPARRYVAPWTPERIALFVRLRDNRAPLARFRKEFGLATPRDVSQKAYQLRKAGVRFRSQADRQRPKYVGEHALARHRSDRTSPHPDSVLRPAIILDGEGRAIATMDPVTRARTPLGQRRGSA